MGVRVNPLEPPLPTGLTNLHCHAHWARSHFDTLIIILQLVHPAHTLTLCTPHFPCTPFTQMAFLLVQVLCSCCFLMKVCYSSGSAVTGRMKWPATYLGPMQLYHLRFDHRFFPLVHVVPVICSEKQKRKKCRGGLRSFPALSTQLECRLQYRKRFSYYKRQIGPRWKRSGNEHRSCN